jgi:hypothetical protein
MLRRVAFQREYTRMQRLLAQGRVPRGLLVREAEYERAQKEYLDLVGQRQKLVLAEEVALKKMMAAKSKVDEYGDTIWDTTYEDHVKILGPEAAAALCGKDKK